MQVSVIVPTHDRRESVRRVLDALGRQSFDCAGFDVIVVADGCRDSTEEMLASYRSPYPLQVLAQAGAGPGAARNAGAARARGEVLLFLDDDVEPEPGLIEAHLRARASDPMTVVLGYLPAVTAGAGSYFDAILRLWWENMFRPLRTPGYRHSYRNVLTGNLSLSRELFEAVGGFDANLRVHEDYELGARLIAAGARLVFAPDAVGRHHEGTDVHRALARKYDEGIADVAIGEKHPALTPTLPLSWTAASRRYRILRRLLFVAPLAGAIALRLGLGALLFAERLGMRKAWKRLLYLLLFGHYWRGVRDRLGSSSAWRAFRNARGDPPPASTLTLDLELGLERAEAEIEQARPDQVELWLGAWRVGSIVTPAGTERLRGAHLRRELLEQHLYALATGLDRDCRVDGSSDPFDRIGPVDPLRRVEPDDPFGHGRLARPAPPAGPTFSRRAGTRRESGR